MYTHKQHQHLKQHTFAGDGLFSVSPVFMPGKVMGFSAVTSPMTELKEDENKYPAKKACLHKGLENRLFPSNHTHVHTVIHSLFF